MKFLIVLCLLAVILIHQCMSAHIHHEGEMNHKETDEDYETHKSHEMGDHKGHKHADCDHPHHKDEDHIGHNHPFGDHIGHRHEDHIAINRRLGFQAEDKK